MTHNYPSWIEISASALRHQVRLFRQLAPHTRLFPVVKGNAYGHGMAEVVSVLNGEEDVAGYMVVSLTEALMLAELTDKSIMILSIWEKDTERVARAVKRGIIFPIYDLQAARWLDAIGAQLGQRVATQVKVDVGTMRLGFRHDDPESIREACNLPNLEVQGLFSHFADSENQDESYTKEQKGRFEKVIADLGSRGISAPMKHIACSAAAIRNSDYHCDAIRIGISMYGLWPSDDIERTVGDGMISMRRVLSWKTRIIQLKHLKKGERVGYGQTYESPHDTNLAVLPIGYWDGYDRQFSNKASVLIRGLRCPVRGRVCMNLTMVEVPHRVRATVGDEVVLIGRQGSEEVTAEELARHANTIHYEVVTRLNPMIPRITI